MAMTADQELRIKALEQAVLYAPKPGTVQGTVEQSKRVVAAAEEFYEFLAKGKGRSSGTSTAASFG